MRKILIALMFLAFLAPLAAQAQIANAAAEKKTESVTVNKDDLKDLITTLESETARTDLIKNLKTLQDAQGKPEAEKVEDAIAPITQTLGVESFGNAMINRYENFLARNNLKSSTVGKLIITGIAALLGVGLAFFFRRAVTKGLYWADRAVTWLDLPAMRLRFYARALRLVATSCVILLMLYTFCVIWDIHTFNPFETEWFAKFLRMALNIFFVVALATLIWEAVNAAVHVTFMRLGGKGSARVSTILPIVRNIMFMVFAILFALVLLSELGINILPLLAGAGIVGIAVGFGAQTMVKDFLSGFTILLEDIVRVGDTVRVDTFSGSVEKITLRKIQLRGASGTVVTIPFSSITTIENMTKDFSAYDFAIALPVEADPDKVFEIITQIVEDMQADPEFGPLILEPVAIWGVDSYTDYSMTIKGRIKTAPGKHWPVQREFNRRRRYAFEKAKIPMVVMPKNFQIAQNINAPAEAPATASSKGPA